MIHLESGSIARITLEDERGLNLLSVSMIQDLQNTLNTLSEDPELKVLILTGSGPKAFCAGAHMEELVALKNPQAYVELGQELMATLESFAVPVLAAVNGYSLGAGFSLALACDLRIVADTAKMGQLAVRNGLVPPFGNLQRLIQAIGASRTRELTYTGRTLKGQAIVDWGLSHQMVPAAELMDATYALAEEIAQAPSYAVRLVKQVIDQTLEEGHAIGYARQEDALTYCLSQDASADIMRGFLKA
jgi:enoyl-CoA hydratase/carnithine racemase